MEPLTFPTPDGLELDLRIPAGTIALRATDTKETLVQVSGERSPDEVTVRLAPRPAGGHHLLVEHKPAPGFGWPGRQAEVRVEIDLPQGATVRCASGSADLTVTGELGSLSHHSGSGDLAFGVVRGIVQVKTGSGDIRGEAVHGDLDVKAASGDIRVERVYGALAVKTASGDTEIGQAEGSTQVASASGDVLIGVVVKGAIQVRTVSGDIAVGVVPGARVWLDLGSVSGDTHSELDAASAEGNAQLEIRASSVSGDVRVNRAEAAMAC